MNTRKMTYLLTGILIIALQILILYEVVKINKNMPSVTTYEIMDDITMTSYYQSHVLNEDDFMDVLASEKDLVIYFRSSNCEHCYKCDEMIISYQQLGYCEYTSVYFAQYDNVPSLYDVYYNVEVTPTMLHINDSKVIDKGEGFEECFELLDEIVQNANT